MEVKNNKNGECRTIYKNVWRSLLYCNEKYFKTLRGQDEPVPQLENGPVTIGCQAALLGMAL